MKRTASFSVDVLVVAGLVAAWPSIAYAPPRMGPPPTIAPAPPEVGSDGSDGAFNPQQNIQIDLSLAPTATWFTPGAGNGIYDPFEWAVVFKYSSVNIPAGVTVTFKNHLSHAPVIWLVQGNVTIAGTVKLDAEGKGSPNYYPEPGPGGFRGGRPGYHSAFGPGGALTPAGGGAHATIAESSPAPIYGNGSIMPLIGGSGGAPHDYYGAPGGGGGGAILIAASGTVAVSATGRITCQGGDSTVGTIASGSGGSIRLLADVVSLAPGSRLDALAGNRTEVWGNGRIRLEANTLDNQGETHPLFTSGTPGPVMPPPGTPKIYATLIDGKTVPADPWSGFNTKFHPDVEVGFSGYKLIQIEAEYVPLDWVVNVRVCNIVQQAVWSPDLALSGTLEHSSTSAVIYIADGITAIQVRAHAPAN